jgi:threonine synthase
MTTDTFFTHLVCSSCSQKYSPREVQTFCDVCRKPLLAVYDLEQARKKLDKKQLANRPSNLWRYRELLPVFDDRNVVSLGEGMTPLIPITNIGLRFGMSQVWVKDESQIPTGSFKARGLAMAVSKALELGVKRVAIPTAGNAGGALAAYAARAGMECYVFMPRDVPRLNFIESEVCGAKVTLVDGIISDCAKKIAEGQAEMGWFDMSTLKEPYRLEGKKTMGLELAEQFDWLLPDVIIYPTGGGTGLIGMWKAFAELAELGWISGKKPRMISAQSSGCDPITRAFNAGQAESEFHQNAATVAAGLRVPKAFGDGLILKAIRDSGGTAISVNDDEIVESIKEVAGAEGIFMCPEGAATWAALKRMKEEGEVNGSERVVLFNTGTGLKYPEIFT